MVALETSVVVAWAEAESRLASLRHHDLREDFHAWYGASGRRYVASVFPFAPCARDSGLPAFDAFVLVPVVRDGPRRRAGIVTAVEWGFVRQRAVADAIADGVNEWHVHLLGASRSEREAIAADLRAAADLGLDRLRIA